jgi:hypothetical protein
LRVFRRLAFLSPRLASLQRRPLLSSRFF